MRGVRWWRKKTSRIPNLSSSAPEANRISTGRSMSWRYDTEGTDLDKCSRYKLLGNVCSEKLKYQMPPLPSVFLFSESELLLPDKDATWGFIRPTADRDKVLITVCRMWNLFTLRAFLTHLPHRAMMHEQNRHRWPHIQIGWLLFPPGVWYK